MHELFLFLSKQTFILLFLTIAIGYLVSLLKWRNISLGIVASTLIVAMLGSFWASRSYGVSFELPQILQTIFFNLYIFSVGLRVGPQCFAGFEKNGKQFLGIGLISIVLTPLLAILCGWILHLDAGTMAGIVAGSNTASAAFGAAQSAVGPNTVGNSAATVAANLSVSFAISYAFSLVGFVITLPYFPKLTKSDAKASAAELDNEVTAGKAPLPQTEGALDVPLDAPIDLRVYRLKSKEIIGKTIDTLAKLYPRVSIEQVRRAGHLLPVNGELVLQSGDEVAVGATIKDQLRAIAKGAEEINAPELMKTHPQTADVVITKPDLVGMTLNELEREVGHGLYYSAAFRMGEQILLGPNTRFKRHDVIRVMGSKTHLDNLITHAGASVKASVSTDILTLAIGLLLGSLVGAIMFSVAGIKIGIGSAAGLLLVSIIASWLRTRYPNLGGPFPESARKLIEDLGLSIFIAIVGLNAGPGLVKALGAGTIAPILITTLIVGFIPAVASWYIGIYFFKLNPALLLGAVTGARQSSPALKVAQDSVNSVAPAVGFPVPFTLTTLIFTFFGYFLVVFWPIK